MPCLDSSVKREIAVDIDGSKIGIEVLQQTKNLHITLHEKTESTQTESREHHDHQPPFRNDAFEREHKEVWSWSLKNQRERHRRLM